MNIITQVTQETRKKQDTRSKEKSSNICNADDFPYNSEINIDIKCGRCYNKGVS